MKKYLLSFLLFILCITTANAQVETRCYENGIKKSSARIGFITKNLSSERIKSHLISEKKIQTNKALLKGIEEDDNRYGIGIDMSYNLDDGEWTPINNGRVWAMSIQSSNAKSLTFVFNNLTLAEGSELYVVNHDQTVVFGPITKNAIGQAKDIVSDIIEGSKATLYLYEPDGNEGSSSLIIKRIVYGTNNTNSAKTEKDLTSTTRSTGDVACYPAWTDASDGVGVVITQDGTTFGGALVMTTDYSFKPYFLTKCDNNISNYNQYAYKFRSRKESCGGNTNVTSYTYYGAQVKASWNDGTKFALLELNSSISKQPDLTWLGWNRGSNTPSSCASIGFKNNQDLIIALKNSAPETATEPSAPTTSWLIYNWDAGIINSKNKGVPLFNQYKRIIGHLYMAGDFTVLHGNVLDLEKRHYYGKFNLSWTGGGQNNNRLSNWLDPINTGATTMNSAHPPYINGADHICSSVIYTLENCPSGGSVVWEVSGEGVDGVTIQRNYPNANQCTISNDYSYPGKINLKAKIYRNSQTIFTVEKNNIKLGTPALGMSVIAEAPDGTIGCWSSDMDGNSFSLEESCAWAYDRIEAKLYRMDSHFNPTQLVKTWNNISVTNNYIPSYSAGWYLFMLRGHNECGESDWLEQEVEFVDFAWQGLRLDYNSYSNVIKISVNSPNVTSYSLNTNRQEIPTSCELQIWDSSNTRLIRKINVKSIPSEISLGEVPNGIFIARAISNGKTTSHKFVKR